MAFEITAMYAALLGLILVALAVNVSLHRGKFQVPMGIGDNPMMLRMVRIHGNAVENIPMAVLLMAIYEAMGGFHLALHIAGIVLIVGRLLHAWGLWQSEDNNFGRVAGQGASWLVTVALAVLILVRLA